jgi:hypothetical protein
MVGPAGRGAVGRNDGAAIRRRHGPPGRRTLSTDGWEPKPPPVVAANSVHLFLAHRPNVDGRAGRPGNPLQTPPRRERRVRHSPGCCGRRREAKTVSFNPGDSILSGSATVTRKTTHGTAKNIVLTLDVVGAFWDTEVDALKYGAFVGTNGKAGWNSVVLTVSCRRHI